MNAELLLKFKEHLENGNFKFRDDPNGKLFIEISMDEKELNSFLKLYDSTTKRISRKKLDTCLNELMDYIIAQALDSSKKEGTND